MALDQNSLQLLMDMLGKKATPDLPKPARVDAQDDGGAYFERAANDPPLDANRLPEMTSTATGRNASGMPGPAPPLDASRYPEDGQMPGHPPTGAAHPPVASGVDALDTFLGGASVRPSAGPLSSPELNRLGSNRANLKDEYEQRLSNATAAGDKRGVDQVAQLLGGVEHDIAADPFTGKAALAKANADADQYHAVSQLNNPESPEAKIAARRDAVALQKSMVEHPNPNVSPFAGGDSIPNVPGAVPGPGAGRAPAGGALGAAPTLPAGGDFEQRFAQGTADLRPEDAANIRALLEYRANIPSGNVLSRPEWSTIVGRARMIDPTFDVTQFDARKKLRESLTTGEAGQRLRSLNALGGHVQQLDTEREALGNSNFGMGENPAVNWLSKNLFGNAGKYNAFDTTHGAVISEAGKFLAGGTATNESRNAIDSGIDSNSQDSAIQGHIAALAGLTKEQYEAILSQAGGVPYLQGLVEKQLTPAARAFLARAQQPHGTVKPGGGIRSMEVIPETGRR